MITGANHHVFGWGDEGNRRAFRVPVRDPYRDRDIVGSSSKHHRQRPKEMYHKLGFSILVCCSTVSESMRVHAAVMVPRTVDTCSWGQGRVRRQSCRDVAVCSLRILIFLYRCVSSAPRDETRMAIQGQ
jgi:hypothetical protein